MTTKNIHLWALDLDSKEKPYQAHLITAIRQGKYGEIRYAECGRDYTKGTHPKGWWTTHGGNYPLDEIAIHCGHDLVTEWRDRNGN